MMINKSKVSHGVIKLIEQAYVKSEEELNERNPFFAIGYLARELYAAKLEIEILKEREQWAG